MNWVKMTYFICGFVFFSSDGLLNNPMDDSGLRGGAPNLKRRTPRRALDCEGGMRWLRPKLIHLLDSISAGAKLLKTNPTCRETLRWTLGRCEGSWVELSTLEAEIVELPEYNEACPEPFFVMQWLVDAGSVWNLLMWTSRASPQSSKAPP